MTLHSRLPSIYRGRHSYLSFETKALIGMIALHIYYPQHFSTCLLNKAAFVFEFCNVLLGPECKAVRESHWISIYAKYKMYVLIGVCLLLAPWRCIYGTPLKCRKKSQPQRIHGRQNLNWNLWIRALVLPQSIGLILHWWSSHLLRWLPGQLYDKIWKRWNIPSAHNLCVRTVHQSHRVGGL